MINLLEETIHKIKDIGLKTSQIKEYCMNITPPDVDNQYDPDRTVMIHGIGEENLLNDPNFNLDYEEELEYQIVDGWISFEDGSWLQRDSEYQDEDDRREDNTIYEYWAYNRCPKLIDYIR